MNGTLGAWLVSVDECWCRLGELDMRRLNTSVGCCASLLSTLLTAHITKAMMARFLQSAHVHITTCQFALLQTNSMNRSQRGS